MFFDALDWVHQSEAERTGATLKWPLQMNCSLIFVIFFGSKQVSWLKDFLRLRGIQTIKGDKEK